MLSIHNRLSARLRREEKGATAVEYGIMVALIAVVIIVAVTLLGNNMYGTFDKIACDVKGNTTYTANAKAGQPGTCAPKA